MNAETTIKASGAYAKLSQARQRFHGLELRKTGKNTFAGYSYFELGDFLIPALEVFHNCGLIGVISFDSETATMKIVDLDNTGDTIVITSPMGSAALKGCHEVQNIGAVETYQRRYLWVAALEIVEHDALDATTGKVAPERITADEPPAKPRVVLDGPYKSRTALEAAIKAFVPTMERMGDLAEFSAFMASAEVVELEKQAMRDRPEWWESGDGEPDEFVPVVERIHRKKRELELAETDTNILHAG